MDKILAFKTPIGSFLRFVNIKIVFFLFSFTLFEACISPPTQPSHLSEDLALVTQLKRGQDFAKSGRARQAEVYFRKALQQLPSSSVYNNLGYSLFSQQRYNEAIEVLQKAVRLDPLNQAAELNLARSYYLSGHLEAAADTYQRLIEKAEKKAVPGSAGDEKEFVSLPSLYRNLAVVSYALGFLDEAICYSSKAYQLTFTMGETEQHSRMLLSLDRVAPALQILQSTVAVHRDSVSSELLYDYGLALFVSGQYSLADKALARVISRSKSSAVARDKAKFLRFMIAEQQRSGNSRQDAAIAEFVELTEAKPDICNPVTQTKKLDLASSYYPQVFFETRSLILQRYCQNEQQPKT